MTSRLKHRNPAPPRYRWELLPKLASEIEYGLSKQAHRDLDGLLHSFASDSGSDLTLRKFRCCQTMSACMRGARRAGADSAVLFQEHLATLKQVSALRTWPAVVRRMHRYLDELFAHRAPRDEHRMSAKVRRMLGEIRATLAQPRTLEHYARQLNVSAAHLSRSFTVIVGRPFRDEVRRLRNEEACRLLVHSTLKLADIARRVGLQSASQFIGDFRKDIGITPAEYRRRHPRRRPVREFAD